MLHTAFATIVASVVAAFTPMSLGMPADAGANEVFANCAVGSNPPAIYGTPGSTRIRVSFSGGMTCFQPTRARLNVYLMKKVEQRWVTVAERSNSGYRPTLKTLGAGGVYGDSWSDLNIVPPCYETTPPGDSQYVVCGTGQYVVYTLELAPAHGGVWSVVE